MIKEQWQYRAALCHTVLHSTVLHCVAQHCAVLCCAVRCCVCSTVQCTHCTALHCTMCSTLCCAALHCAAYLTWSSVMRTCTSPARCRLLVCWAAVNDTGHIHYTHTHRQTHPHLWVKSLLTRTTVEMCILLCLSWWTRHNIMHKN